MDARPSNKRIKREFISCPSLPEEIVEEILSRLPSKSLHRFRCVSRWFDAVITSRVFQETHFERNRANTRLFFMKETGIHRELFFYAWQPDGGGSVEKLTRRRTDGGGHHHRVPQGSIFPLGSRTCHGLILLSCPSYHLHLVCNPSTCDVITLPDGIPFGSAGGSNKLLVSYGLGFCSATKRHKVVRIYSSRSAAKQLCEVFTLNESAYWRPAAEQPPPHATHDNNWRQGAVFCNDNLHFLQKNGFVTTFSIKDETFGVLKPPPEVLACSLAELAEVRGCLCVYSCFSSHWPDPNQQQDSKCDVWLLRDYYDDGGCWEKLCSVDWSWAAMLLKPHFNSSSWIAPFDIIYDDGNCKKKIMFRTSTCTVFAVDPSTGTPELLDGEEARTTIMGSEPEYDQRPAAALFEESLAVLGRTGEAITFSSPTMRAWSEVLSRLPARTVGSLNQVCRSWRAMIKTDLFAAAHLHNANLNRSLQMVFLGGSSPTGFVTVDRFAYSSPTATSLLPPLIDNGLGVVCSKPCHGLNAGSYGGYDFVCNPATSYFKALSLDNESWDWQKVSLYDFLKGVPSCRNDAMFAARLGLGYEQETSRHVLVRLTLKQERKTGSTTSECPQMVCKMRYVDDLFWEKLDPPSRPIANMPPAYANGKLYWIVVAM